MSVSDVIVIGAGVLGLSSAAELAARGRAVTVVDPGGANASSVAAGMIAPAMETLSDLKAGEDRSALYRAAAALWPGFADRHGVTLHREGAVWRGRGEADAHAPLAARGFDVKLRDGEVFAADEARVDPVAALRALGAGPNWRRGRAAAVERAGDVWAVALEGGGRLIGRDVVIASGAVSRIAAPLSVEALLGLVTPIKGQLAFVPERLTDHVVWDASGYVAPADGGSVIGGTMQVGKSDLTVDEAAGEALVRGCLDTLGLADAPPLEWRVGVRGASPDGLPMAGMIEPGLHVALAPRRNGWLMGPLVARVVADGVEGRAPGEWVAALDPFRFG